MSKTTIKKWLCGSRWGGEPYDVAEVEFVETPKRYTLVDTSENKAALRNVAGYIGVQFSKTDKRLHDTREAAIRHAIQVRTQERHALVAKLAKAKLDLEHLERMLSV